eukprot:360870-Chlamydomonas_euryale.AAC.15
MLHKRGPGGMNLNRLPAAGHWLTARGRLRSMENACVRAIGHGIAKLLAPHAFHHNHHVQHPKP